MSEQTERDRRSLSRGLTTKAGVWGVVGMVLAAIAALIGVGAFPKLNDIADKSELSAVRTDLSVHIKEETAITSELKTKTALTEQAVVNLAKSQDRIERLVEAQGANVETLMRAVEIPERRIKKPKEED